MFVVVARYYTKQGMADDVLSTLKQAVPIFRAEPGCRVYFVNQSIDDPRRILLYEQYVDEAAFRFHLGREEFAELIKGRIWPLLESREREIYVTVEPQDGGHVNA